VSEEKLKSVNIWRSYKQERDRLVYFAKTLLKDGKKFGEDRTRNSEDMIAEDKHAHTDRQTRPSQYSAPLSGTEYINQTKRLGQGKSTRRDQDATHVQRSCFTLIRLLS